MSKARLRNCFLAVGFSLFFSLTTFGAEPGGPPATNAALPAVTTNTATTTVSATATNSSSEEMLRAYLQLQEQLHQALLAIDRNRLESESASAKNTKLLTDRLGAIEQSLETQHASDLEAAQSFNHTLLLVVSGFAGFGCLAVLLTAFLHWRVVNRFASLSSTLAAGRGPGPWPAMGALGSGEHPNALAALGPIRQPETHLLEAIQRLEKRLLEMEGTATKPLKDAAEKNGSAKPASPTNGNPAAPAEAGAGETPSEINPILRQGQALLNQNRFEEAVACFEQLLAEDPQHAEALVKKGSALEHLRKTEEALECYDRAIALDGSLTIAYLCKGGLCNRLERYGDALKCYEQALRTQEKRRAS